MLTTIYHLANLAPEKYYSYTTYPAITCLVNVSILLEKSDKFIQEKIRIS